MMEYQTVTIIFCGFNFDFESVYILHHNKAIELIIYCYKGSISHHKSLFDQEVDHSNFTVTASNTLQNIKLFDFHQLMWNPFIGFFHQVNFLKMVWYCWNNDSHYLRHFSGIWHFEVSFVQLIFLDVDCQLQMNVLNT